MKRCTVCKERKPVGAFRRAKGYKDGIYSRCKSCEADTLREWRRSNPAKRQAQNRRSNDQRRKNKTGYYSSDEAVSRRRRNNHLVRKYGITLEQYEAQVEKQNGLCAACGELPSTRAGSSPTPELVVDHCHERGHVRGLICARCNHVAGQAGDDPKILRAVADFLEMRADD